MPKKAAPRANARKARSALRRMAQEENIQDDASDDKSYRMEEEEEDEDESDSKMESEVEEGAATPALRDSLSAESVPPEKTQSRKRSAETELVPEAKAVPEPPAKKQKLPEPQPQPQPAAEAKSSWKVYYAKCPPIAEGKVYWDGVDAYRRAFLPNLDTDYIVADWKAAVEHWERTRSLVPTKVTPTDNLALASPLFYLRHCPIKGIKIKVGKKKPGMTKPWVNLNMGPMNRRIEIQTPVFTIKFSKTGTLGNHASQNPDLVQIPYATTDDIKKIVWSLGCTAANHHSDSVVNEFDQDADVALYCHWLTACSRMALESAWVTDSLSKWVRVEAQKAAEVRVSDQVKTIKELGASAVSQAKIDELQSPENINSLAKKIFMEQAVNYIVSLYTPKDESGNKTEPMPHTETFKLKKTMMRKLWKDEEPKDVPPDVAEQHPEIKRIVEDEKRVYVYPDVYAVGEDGKKRLLSPTEAGDVLGPGVQVYVTHSIGFYVGQASSGGMLRSGFGMEAKTVIYYRGAEPRDSNAGDHGTGDDVIILNKASVPVKHVPQESAEAGEEEMHDE